MEQQAAALAEVRAAAAEVRAAAAAPVTLAPEQWGLLGRRLAALQTGLQVGSAQLVNASAPARPAAAVHCGWLQAAAHTSPALSLSPVASCTFCFTAVDAFAENDATICSLCAYEHATRDRCK